MRTFRDEIKQNNETGWNKFLKRLLKSHDKIKNVNTKYKKTDIILFKVTLDCHEIFSTFNTFVLLD